jgi:hypothetical protein
MVMEMGYSSGGTLLGELGRGITEATPQLRDSIEGAQNDANRMLEFHSPPEEGPWSTGVLANAGVGILTEIGRGLDEGRSSFEEGFALVLEEATTYAVNKMHQRAVDELKAQQISAQIMGTISAQYGGILSEDDKKILRTSLDMSGLFGVIGAIVTDGAETRKILAEIRDNTAMKGGKGGVAGGQVGDARQPG